MKRITAISLGLLLSLSAAPAFADDLNPPEWRGAEGSTMQAWEFSTDANPATPDVDLNPYGVASLFVEGSFPTTRWKSEDLGHAGVWKFEDFMLLDVPNNPEPNEYKLIWLQLTYYADETNEPEVLTIPEETSVEVVNKVPVDDNYYHVTFLLTLMPNPASEQIYIMPRNCTLYVDELVLDTLCAPEPASVLLLAVAGLLIRRR